MTGTLRAGLDAMRTAATEGNLAALAEISAMLETNLAELESLSPDELAAVGRAAAENVPRLEAALRGVRAARRRLAELAEAERPATYDRTGRKQNLVPSAQGRKL